MKKQVKEQVLEFMQSTDTSEMNSSQFIYDFLYFEWDSRNTFDYFDFKSEFLASNPESITRARRYIIKTHGIGVRTKSDKEKDYIDEYSLENKF